MSTGDGDVRVRVEGVAKKFCRDLKRSLWYGLQDSVADLMGRDGSSRLRRDEFWAVENVSFELRAGECLGLLGRNGAGKTTLLKMLNGLIKPDFGRIELRGRVGALIALGAGFNPVLTGRENVYVNGSVLGWSKRQIDRKLDEIVDFAEIGEFIDTPVQSYSSGMLVRLGFAVASHIEPDILLVDEVLAVGDAGFKIKCYNKIFELRKRAAIIFVSHSMSQVGKVCTHGLVLQSGRMLSEATPIGDAVHCYLDQFDGPGMSALGDGSIEIERICIRQASGPLRVLYPHSQPNRRTVIDAGLETELQLDCQNLNATGPIRVIWSIIDLEQKLVAQAVSGVLNADVNGCRMRIRAKIKALNMNRGRYSMSVVIFSLAGGARDVVLTGLSDFGALVVRRGTLAGSAPILYPNETELISIGASEFGDPLVNQSA